MATLKFAERRRKKEEEEAEAKKAAEAAAREERRRREEEEEQKKLSAAQSHPPEAWDVFVGGGPILSSTASESADPNDRLNYLLNKLMLLGT